MWNSLNFPDCPEIYDFSADGSRLELAAGRFGGMMKQGRNGPKAMNCVWAGR
jgi:hypothetical protein